MSGTRPRRRPWQLEDPDWPRERYVEQGMTALEIALDWAPVRRRSWTRPSATGFPPPGDGPRNDRV